MGKIIILDENTSNKIAAGEVVEKPASVIKELIENSIDANASSISIEIKNGGISYIKVTDNGTGISEDDMEIAFERHATSKIRHADDLDSISTMGFRGEALASIAAVSTVEVTSRVREKNHGTYIKIHGGSVKEVRQTGCPSGTSFVVRNLFYNTPARFKFLKKDSTEAGYVSDSVSRIALGNPHISFRLVSNNSPVLHTPGNNDLLSTIFSIYGKETAKEVVEVNYSDHKIKITGYVGKPTLARSNRAQQSIYINHRYIKSKIITSAIDESYKTFLLKNKHAFVVLNIEINPLLVDVNVHPQKMEVRFSEEQHIFTSIFHAINNALLSKPLIKNVELDAKDRDFFKFKNTMEVKPDYTQQSLRPQKHINKELNSELDYKESRLTEETSYQRNKGLTPEKPLNVGENSTKAINITEGAEYRTTEHYTAEYGKDIKNSSTDKEKIYAGHGAFETAKDIPDNREKSESAGKNTDIAESRSPKMSIPADGFEDVEPAGNGESTPLSDTQYVSSLSEARVIGQVFSTYILLQQDNDMILIDQHAAHERIMYEGLKSAFLNNKPLSQLLIAPVAVELTYNEIRFLNDEKEFFNKIGYIYEDFGNNSIIIRAVPDTGEFPSIKETFLEVVDNVMGWGKAEKGMLADETLYTIACKAAIKANKKLDGLEIQNILRELAKLENPYTCPHGRPTIIKISKYELEKKFKRIV